MIDYNLNIESFSNKKFQCLCSGTYTRDGLTAHSYTTKCVTYRIKNNLPILKKKQIICEICNTPYSKSQKKNHEGGERHQEYLKYYHIDDMDNLIDQFNKISI